MNPKTLIKIGGVTAGIGLLALIYNFFNMYSIPGKCPEDVDVKPCQFYDNWITLNKIGLIVLIIGAAILIAGIVRQRQDKT